MPRMNALVTEDETNEDQLAGAAYADLAAAIRTQAETLYAKVTEVNEEILALKDRFEVEDQEEQSHLIAAVEHAYARLDEIRDQLYEVVALALHGRYTPADVRAWCDRAMDMGALHPRLDGKVIEDLLYLRRVPNAPFRERYLAIAQAEETERKAYGQEESWASGRHGGDQTYLDSSILQHVIKEMGWQDVVVRRNLGLLTRPADRGFKSLTLFLDYEAASRLASTLGLKPYEVGI